MIFCNSSASLHTVFLQLKSPNMAIPESPRRVEEDGFTTSPSALSNTFRSGKNIGNLSPTSVNNTWKRNVSLKKCDKDTSRQSSSPNLVARAQTTAVAEGDAAHVCSLFDLSRRISTFPEQTSEPISTFMEKLNLESFEGK